MYEGPVVSPESGVTILSPIRGSEGCLFVVIEWIKYFRDINVRSDGIFRKTDKEGQKKNWLRQVPLRGFYSLEWRCPFTQIKEAINECTYIDGFEVITP